MKTLFPLCLIAALLFAGCKQKASSSTAPATEANKEHFTILDGAFAEDHGMTAVAAVFPGSAPEKAGVRVGDVLLKKIERVSIDSAYAVSEEDAGLYFKDEYGVITLPAAATVRLYLCHPDGTEYTAKFRMRELTEEEYLRIRYTYELAQRFARDLSQGRSIPPVVSNLSTPHMKERFTGYAATGESCQLSILPIASFGTWTVAKIARTCIAFPLGDTPTEKRIREDLRTAYKACKYRLDHNEELVGIARQKGCLYDYDQYGNSLNAAQAMPMSITAELALLWLPTFVKGSPSPPMAVAGHVAMAIKYSPFTIPSNAPRTADVYLQRGTTPPVCMFPGGFGNAVILGHPPQEFDTLIEDLRQIVAIYPEAIAAAPGYLTALRSIGEYGRRQNGIVLPP